MIVKFRQRRIQTALVSRRLLPTVLVAAVVLLLHVGPAVDAKADVYIEDADRFPGWKGELPQQQPLDKAAGGATVGFGESGEEEWRGVVEQVAWTPRAFKYHGLLSDEECDHLMNGVKDRMTKSTVVDNKTGKSMDSNVRTSTGSFYSRGNDEVIQRIEKRLSHITFLPEENGEGLQILHYVNGQEYKPHHDFFNDEVNARPENGGQRIATVLMYLTTPEEGGETIFPKAQTKTDTSGPQWSPCARDSGGLAVKAKKGDALMFYSLKPNGDTDDASLHGSCPTLKGEKWSATKWIHVAGFGISSEAQRAKWGECIDADDRCEEWAVAGECEKNKPYMLKYCRPACKVCDPDARKGEGSPKLDTNTA